jgi:AraC family transcriptional regulator
MIGRIGSLSGRGDALARLLRESLAEGLRLHIRDRYGEAGPPQQQVRPVRVFGQSERQRLVEFLRDGLDQDIDIASLAGLVGMTVHDFRPAFARTFHTTPYQFVLGQRIDHAKTLLATTTLSVAEVSAATGFSTPSHFTMTFKQRVGVTPSAYRRDS